MSVHFMPSVEDDRQVKMLRHYVETPGCHTMRGRSISIQFLVIC